MIYNLRSKLPLLAVVLCGVLLFVLWHTPASNAQDNGPAASLPNDQGGTADMLAVPVPGGPGFYSGHAISILPWPSNSVPYHFSGMVLYNPDTSSHPYEVAVTLPHNAVITKFVVWYYDDNAINDMWGALARAGLDGSGIVQIGRIDSTGAVASVQYAEDTTIDTPLVDNQSYMYWVEVLLPPDSSAGFVSFRIDYQYTSSLPIVTK